MRCIPNYFLNINLSLENSQSRNTLASSHYSEEPCCGRVLYHLEWDKECEQKWIYTLVPGLGGSRARSTHINWDFSNSMVHFLADSTIKGTWWSLSPQGSFCMPLCQLLKWISYLLLQASYWEMPGFPWSLEVFFSLSHFLPLKALLLSNHDLCQSLKFKVHCMKSLFLEHLSNGSGY